MAYPFGIIGVIIFVQSVFKIPQTKKDIFEEKHSPTAVENKVHVKKYQVTNPNCTGKSLVEIHFHGMTKANITRVKRGDKIFMAYDDTVLKLDDIIMAVGTDKELLKLENLLGKESHAEMDYVKDIVGRDVFVSSPKIVGKTLEELEVKELFGVVITRLRREEVEMVPGGNTSLEVGDLIHVVGDAEDCERFVSIVGQKERRIHETNLLPLALGIVCGSCLGIYPIRLPGEITFKLGLAGGPLLVALVIGHFGRIGRLSTRIPYPAKYITREIGLAFFLAVAGTKAGGSFYEVFKQTGPLLMLYGAIITTTVITTFYGLSRFLFKLSNLASIGVVCGAMTCTPALSVINDKVESETPTINYASIYAIAMVLITVISQILALALK